MRHPLFLNIVQRRVLSSDIQNRPWLQLNCSRETSYFLLLALIWLKAGKPTGIMKSRAVCFQPFISKVVSQRGFRSATWLTQCCDNIGGRPNTLLLVLFNLFHVVPIQQWQKWAFNLWTTFLWKYDSQFNWKKSCDTGGGGGGGNSPLLIFSKKVCITVMSCSAYPLPA